MNITLGCRSLSGGQSADGFCRSFGMRAISLDNPDKTRFAMNMVAQDREKYFWTGGNMVQGGVQWPSRGQVQAVDQVGPWSHTGG